MTLQLTVEAEKAVRLSHTVEEEKVGEGETGARRGARRG